MGICTSVFMSDSYLPTPQDVSNFSCGAYKHLTDIPCTSGCNTTLLQTMSSVLGLACTVALSIMSSATTTAYPVMNSCALNSGYPMSPQEAISSAIREADKALTIPGYKISWTRCSLEGYNTPTQGDVAFMMVLVAILGSRREFPSVGRALAFTCLPELFYSSPDNMNVSTQALQVIALFDNLKYPTTGRTLLPGQMLFALTPFFLVCGEVHRCFSTEYAKAGKVCARGPNVPVSPGLYRLTSLCKPVLYFSESSPPTMVITIRSSLDSTCPKYVGSKLSGLPKSVRKEVQAMMKAQAATYGSFAGMYGCVVDSTLEDEEDYSTSSSSSSSTSSSESESS